MRISDWSSDVCSSDLCRAPIFGDPDVEIFEVTTVEHDALRVDLGVADALSNVEFEVAAGHEYPLDQKLFFVSRKDAKARRRSEARRVGKACVRTGRSRWEPDY